MKKKLTHHLMRAALGLFVMMLTANLGWAQVPIGGLVWNTTGGYYEISSQTDLQDLAVYVNGTGTYSTNVEETIAHTASGMVFKMTQDITLTEPHTPIGGNYNSKLFCGTFETVDGSLMKISNLSINNTDGVCLGLFGSIGSNAVIRNIHLDNCNIKGKTYVGGIAGYADCSSTYRATIENCHVTGTIDSNNGYNIGGIIGYASGVNVSLCENAADIIGTGTRCGGIVGWATNTYSFQNCLNRGRIYGTSYLAGIAGSGSYSNFSNCCWVYPCNVKGICNTSSSSGIASDYGSGKTTRGFSITFEGPVTAEVSPAANNTCTPITNSLTGLNYYASGDWYVTFTLQEGYTFVGLACDGGTMTNLDDLNAEHKLTFNYTTSHDATISCYASNDSGINVNTNPGIIIDPIPDQRWRGSFGVIPTINMTYNNVSLDLGTDYVVSCINNTAKGVATINIIGINQYTGTASRTFNIVDFPLLDPENPTNSEENPYLIANETDLEALACVVNSGSTNGRIDGYYRQTENITLTSEHTPIGTSSISFNGVYDGYEKIISNLNTSGTTKQGLFGYTRNGAIIKNVRLINSEIRGEHAIGGIVGVAGSNSTVQNCFVDATTMIAEGNQSMFGYIGSIVGENYGTLIDNYHTSSTIGGVGTILENHQTTGIDQPGAEIVVKITAGDGIGEIIYPATPSFVWGEDNLYKSGVVVTLTCTVPTGEVFDHYAVSNGTISNAGFATGEHIIEGFTDNVVVSAIFAESMLNLGEGGTIADIDPLTFNGQEQLVLPDVTYNNETLVKDVNYTVSYTKGGNPVTVIKDAGTYNVIATGCGRYEGSISREFVINPFDISGVDAISVSGIYSDYGQTGTEIHPVPAVTCAATNNATLLAGTDYSLSYSTGCTLPGTYNVIIAGTGNYTGTVSIPFTIVDAYALTVYDGTTANYNIPVIGSTSNWYNKSELVMPSAMLAAMNGKALTTMRFYLSTKATGNWGNARWRVFMKEVDFDRFTSPYSFSDTDGATVVYDGALDGTQDVMIVNFSTPYVYHGGNLLIGFYQYEKGTYKGYTRFYGVNNNNIASIYGSSDSSLESISNTTSSATFLPKTTFWYQDAVTLTVAGYNPGGTGDDDLSRWKFIASPVAGSVNVNAVDNLVDVTTTGGYDLYRFNQSKDLEWENYKVHNSDTENPFNTLVNGKGYLYASKNDVTLIFTGTFNSEEPFGVTLDFDEGMEFAGWNLVGNPFPEAATIDRSYYKISEDGKRVDPTEHSESIPACTGVMVHAESTSDNTVTFNRSRTQNMVNNGVLRIDVAQNNMRGASTGSATVDKAIVSFNEGDQLPKFVFNKDYAKVYIPQGNKDYAIVSTEKQGELPLNFEATENGSYTLTVNPEGVEMNYLHLIDNMTGTDIDLLATPSYTFNAKTTDYTSRFRLVFVTRDASTGSASDETFAFFSNGNWIIGNEGEATLQVIDINGRVLSDETISGSVSTTFNAVPGVYVLRLINGENVRTQKVVVR